MGLIMLRQVVAHFLSAKGVACETRPAIVQSYSQSQTRVRFRQL